jgi:hypothetical protein
VKKGRLEVKEVFPAVSVDSPENRESSAYLYQIVIACVDATPDPTIV